MAIFLLSLSSANTPEPLLFQGDHAQPGRRRATVIGLLVALFVHLLLYLCLPEKFYPVPIAVSPADEIELELEMAAVEEPSPESLRFVEANPEVPENTPDRSDQYSYRSTQAADQSPEASILEAPKVDGEEPSQKIIDGELESAVVLPRVVVAGGASNAAVEAAAQAPGAPPALPEVPSAPRLPTAEFIEQTELPEDPAGTSPLNRDTENAALEALPEDGPIALYQNTEAADTVEPGSGVDTAGIEETRIIPRVRPRLAPELLTGPIMQSLGSASRRGALSIDATFSEFGEYEQQFYAALQLGWYQEIEFHQPMDTASSVAVRFTMQADGTIHDIDVVQSNASPLATLLCESALAKRSPFRSWTKEMIAVFGTERTLTIRFNYR